MQAMGFRYSAKQLTYVVYLFDVDLLYNDATHEAKNKILLVGDQMVYPKYAELITY